MASNGAVQAHAHSDVERGSDKQPPAWPARVRLMDSNPGPLGLLAFGMTTCMLMFVETSWSQPTFLASVFGYAMFYGGFGQFVAGVLEFINGNTFAGTAFCSYGSFWMGWFLTHYLTSQKLMGAQDPTGEILYLVLWGVFTAGLFVPTLRKTLCLVVVFSTLTLTFFLLAGGVHSANCKKAAGYAGFVCGCSAIYAAFAQLYMEDLGIQMPGLKPIRFI